MVQVLNEKKRKSNLTENAMRNTDLQTNTMISFERNEFIRKILLGKDVQVEISSALDNRSISSVSAAVSD
jgi:hypothetical protein